MIIDHDTFDDVYTVECDKCYHQWIYEGYEIELEPFPHFVCPHCDHWIPLF